MPLKKGSSKKVISKNIGELVNAYKKTGKIGNTKPKSKKKAAQIASAIAYSKAKNESFDFASTVFALLTESEELLNKISKPEKNKITKDLAIAGLDGNGRFSSATKGLQKTHEVFYNNGFVIDATDRIHSSAGDDGHITLRYRRKLKEDEDKFSEGVEIKNSLVSFSWHKFNKDADVFEICVYAS